MPLKLMTLACPANQDQIVIGIKHTVEANELKLKIRQETEWYQKKNRWKKEEEEARETEQCA
jgi:thiamine pyrophosphate-dependent acetolactate synthase large subunit-like protein